MTRLALFKSGGAEIMPVQPNDASTLQKAGYSILNYPAGANVLVPDSLNADSAWSNIKVRMAAEYAIDREALSSTFGYGFNPPAYQASPASSAAYIPAISGRKYDVAKAKQLLTEAGYPSGFKTTIIAQATGDRNTAAAIQAYLKVIGIQADISFVEPAKYAALTTGTYDNAVLLDQLRSFPNFNAVLAQDFGTPAFFYKSLKKPDGWQAIYNATANSQAQDPVLMQKASQALYDDCTVIPLTYYASTYVTQSYVHDSGRGTMGSGTQFTPQNAWLTK
jgi:peptide/nickel transport system substrate-binding protein